MSAEKHVLLIGWILICAAGTATAQQITVGQNVQVSAAKSGHPHYEIHLAADPRDPMRLLGGGMIWDRASSRYGGIAYASRDGGRTWTPTLELVQTGTVNDPAIAFGPDGLAYFAAFGNDAGKETEMYVHRSADGGQTWAGRTRVPVMDREWLSVDRTSGKYHGRVYVNGTRGAPGIDGRGASGISIARSADGGLHFDALTLVVSEPLHYILGMGNSVVLSDGTLVVLFGTRRDRNAISPYEPVPGGPNAWLKVLTSQDGAETFSPAVTVADWHMRFPSTLMPYLAADASQGVFRDRLYSVWNDVRSGRGQILLSYSSDKGRTWSGPVVVDDALPAGDGSKPNNFMPYVAVNGQGVVGVMWYDRRDNADDRGYWPRFAASIDGGETFSPSVRVSTAPFDLNRAEGLVFTTNSSSAGRPGGPLRAEVTFHGFNQIGGHTAGLAAAADDRFHPFWVDNRTGVPQIWTAGVSVSGSAQRHGDPSLAELQDVSAKVTLQLTNVRYDPGSGTASMDAALVNTSTDTLRGPIKLRILSLASQHGTPELRQSDNGKSGSGALLDFTGQLQAGRLAPKGVSTTRRLEFRLKEPRPLGTPGEFPRGRGGSAVVSIDARVLAGK